METDELVAIIESEVASSIGGGGAGSGGAAATARSGSGAYTSQQLATERAMELDYYNSRPFGNEREGESQVVTSDVFDAIESMLPQLLKTFTASDDVIEFQPEGAEDDAAARRVAAVCNYVFHRQHPSLIIMYEGY